MIEEEKAVLEAVERYWKTGPARLPKEVSVAVKELIQGRTKQPLRDFFQALENHCASAQGSERVPIERKWLYKQLTDAKHYLTSLEVSVPSQDDALTKEGTNP